MGQISRYDDSTGKIDGRHLRRETYSVPKHVWSKYKRKRKRRGRQARVDQLVEQFDSEPQEKQPLHPKQQAAYDRLMRNNERADGFLTWKDIREIFYWQQRRCYYCTKEFEGGRVPSEARFHIEHKKPICQGGKNHKHNIVLACPACNREKWIADDTVYIASRRRRGLKTISRAEQFRSWDLPERMEEQRHARERARKRAEMARLAENSVLRRRPERG